MHHGQNMEKQKNVNCTKIGKIYKFRGNKENALCIIDLRWMNASDHITRALGASHWFPACEHNMLKTCTPLVENK